VTKDQNVWGPKSLHTPNLPYLHVTHPANSLCSRNQSCRTKSIDTHTVSPHSSQFSVRPYLPYGHHLNNPDPPMGNSVVMEPGETREEASRESRDAGERQPFPMG